MKKKVCYTLLMLTIGISAAMLGGCGSKEKEEPASFMEPIEESAAEADSAEAAGGADNTETAGSAEESVTTDGSNTTNESDSVDASAQTPEATTDESNTASETATTPDTPDANASTTTPARQDGERFEDVIILEGMEEKVQYEHAINSTIGIEIDYDYESFTRKNEGDHERFISIYDDAANPENYLEITYSSDNAETTAEAIGEELSKEYDIHKDTYTLDNVGDYISIDASEAKGGGGTPDLLQSVYVVPAGDGCIVATAHYSFEAAEGFGRRFSYMMDTLILE